MPFSATYEEAEPTRAEVDQSSGLVLLEFGADWCGHCRALSPTLSALLHRRSDVRHIRVADGRGRPLGRSFRVKLWPTLVLLRDGTVVEQLVRPSPEEVQRAFAELQ